MDLVGFLKNFKINTYYSYLLYLSGLTLILSLVVDFKSIDNIYVMRVSIWIIVASVIVWILENTVQHFNRYTYELHLKKSVNTMPPHDIMSDYYKKAFYIIIGSLTIQVAIWGFVVFHLFR